jgi:hypothetical protein
VFQQHQIALVPFVSKDRQSSITETQGKAAKTGESAVAKILGKCDALHLRQTGERLLYPEVEK